ncbi:MAG: hypothetical protein VKP70_01250 [Cyanobacteriota bacterium]|nr:hypothetical protein [Cyanobacteriota bacterium]
MSPPRPSRGLPTSRAYWELKAEQMMNRVFAQNAPIDLDSPPADREPAATLSSSHRPQPPLPPPRGPVAAAPAAPATGVQPPKAGSDLKVVVLATLGGVGLVAALGAVLLVQQWTGLQRSLSQERSLLLVERIRSLGPANAEVASAQANATPPAPVLDPAPAAESRGVAFDGLPPPPPEEPWMQQLSSLPPSSEGRAPLLRVPLSPRLAAVAPAAASGGAPSRAPSAPRRERPSGPLPQLVGLVGAPGHSGSAIFQVGDASINVNVGEPIGGSGWRLRAADAESALIERGSEVRRIAIITGG